MPNPRPILDGRLYKFVAYHAGMFVSVTRLRIRSVRFLPAFFLSIHRTNGQVRRAGGFIVGELLVDRRLTFWTLTGWADERAMINYRNSGSHRIAMPRLLRWCDEAAAAHWTIEDPDLPSWAEGYEKLKSQGFLTKVNYPSADHTSRTFDEPRLTIRRKIAASAPAT